MGKQKILFVAMSLLLAFLLCGVSIAAYVIKEHKANEIEQGINGLLDSSPSDISSTGTAYIKLVELLCHTPEWEISDMNVNSAILLIKNNSIYQTENAAVLAAMGSRATKALPELEGALKETLEFESIKCPQDSKSSDDIKMAINVIKTPASSSRCHKEAF